MRRMLKRLTLEDALLNAVIVISMAVLVAVTLYPFLNVIAVSFNDAMDSLRGGIGLWPREFTLNNYKNIFRDTQIFSAILTSVLRTVIGTVFSLAASVSLAYIISKRDFVFRKQLSVFMIMTMYFSGGIIPTYFLYRQLGLINNFAVYVVPGLISAWNVIVIRSYIDGLPVSMEESAKIDGANDFTILVRIILPLITPVVATIALFCAVHQWNSWFDTYIYASGKPHLSTLQFELMKRLSSVAQNLQGNAAYNPAQMAQKSNAITPESIRATMTVGDITHPELIAALAEAGHGTNIVIADANFPSDIGVPPTAKKIYLNFAPNQLKVPEVLKRLVKVVDIEAAAAPVRDDMEDVPVFPEYRELLPDGMEIRKLTRWEFRAECMKPETGILIQTADLRLYCCIILTVGVRTED